jgi:hypothetical protein
VILEILVILVVLARTVPLASNLPSFLPPHKQNLEEIFLLLPVVVVEVVVMMVMMVMVVGVEVVMMVGMAMMEEMKVVVVVMVMRGSEVGH